MGPLLFFWLAAAICLAAEAAIVRGALARTPPASSGVPGPSRRLEVLYALLPALMLGIVLALTWRAIAAGGAS